MPQCLISLGANMGDPLATIHSAIDSLRQQLACQPAECRLSRFYHTPSVGGPVGQPPFINAVIAITTSLSPWEVWHAVRRVEQMLGRERLKRWEARRIDLDILLYDDLRIWTPQLKIPHPRMCMRRFILEPAADVAAEWIDPVSLSSIGQLTRRLRGGSGNLLLWGNARSRTLLERVAREAVAHWCCAEMGRAESGEIKERQTQSRWVRWLPIEKLNAGMIEAEITPSPKLTIVLTEANENSGAQWEDIHRGLAERMRLSAPAKQSLSPNAPSDLQDTSVGVICGARYLLATDDQEWAVHEMISALEAMDCPVEPVLH
jgi:2-amino-4-hydroxy-6-hydroxymethyldihydropteridine diphosphokinase